MSASRRMPASRPRPSCPWTCARRTTPSSRATGRPSLAPGDAQPRAERLLVVRLAHIFRGLDGEACALEHTDELRGPARTREADFQLDDAARDQIRQRLLHRLHAAARVRLHHRIDLLDFALADEVADGVVRQQDLERRNASLSVGRRKQSLGDDALQRAGDLNPDLLLLLGREDVDDSVDRRGRALRMQRSEDEVTGLRSGERGRDRLEVAHLAHEDHVGVLAESGTQSLAEARCIGPDLALVDDAAFVAVQKLDRVLDREDVLRAVPVDLVDDGGERRRLTGAGRAGDEDEATWLLGQLVQGRRDAELLQGLDLGGDKPKSRPDRLPLEIDVDTEARQAGNRVREIELPLDLEILLLLAREDAVEQLLRPLRREGVVIAHALDFSTHANDRRRSDGHMEV